MKSKFQVGSFNIDLLKVEDQVAAIIEELNLADRAYFAKDRQKVIKAKIDQAITLLDTKPIEGLGKLNGANIFRT